MLLSIMRNEWRTLVAERSLPAIAVLLALTIGYGVYNGHAWVSFMRESLAATEAEYAERTLKLKADFWAYEAGTRKPVGFSDPRGASAVGGTAAVPYVTMTPGPLAALSVGQSDLYPYYFKLSLRSKYLTLSNDEIENPVNLLSGRFDLAFVIVYLYPLLILALSYNLLSSEREQGTLAITLANPVTLKTLMAGKVLTRGVALAGLSLAILALAMLGLDWTQGGIAWRLALWAAVMLLYGAFWFVLAVGINALGRNSSTNALLLAGCWLCFALLVPALLNLASSALYPVPSRVEMIQAMRNAGKEAQQRGSQTLARYFEDHPELAPAGGARPDFASLSTAAQQEVDRHIQPILERYERQVSAQQNLVDRFCYLSPAVLTQQALNDLAGTGIGAYRHFNEQAGRFLKTWQDHFFPLIFARKLFSSAELANLPQYTELPEPGTAVVRRVLLSVAGILLPTLALAVWAIRRLNRYRVAG